MHVLTVLDREADAASLVVLSYRLAEALRCSLSIVCLEDRKPESDTRVVPLATLNADNGGPLCRQVETTLAAVAPATTPIDDNEPEPPAAPLAPAVTLRIMPQQTTISALLHEVAAADASYVLAAKRGGRQATGELLGRKLFAQSPTHVLLVRPGAPDPGPLRRILVPTAGGPHSDTALRVAESLARAAGGAVTALRVHGAEGELPQDVGERSLERTIRRSALPEGASISQRVVLADNRISGLRDVAEEGFDLVLMGASGAGNLRAHLFGNLTERFLRATEGTTVAVVRRQWHWADRLKARIGRWLDVTVPQLRREDRVKLYETLESGSAWNFDFMALICLSTAIAALGLLQNSGAVVIGAMLVAPLMTPILGAGLALVQGNVLLLRNALRSIVLGYLMALGIGLVLGWLFPIPALTPELLGRGGPTLLDLGVALLSGLAAAYCVGRPGLVAALPGVAIAAALVPPIATTGISLALGARANAAGAALLFGTNVTAIILGAAAALWGAGVRGAASGDRRKTWVRTAFLLLLLGATGLSIPLASSTVRGRPIQKELRHSVAAQTESLDATHLIAVREVVDQQQRVVEIVVQAPAPLGPAAVEALARAVRQHRGTEQAVRVRTEIVHQAP